MPKSSYDPEIEAILADFKARLEAIGKFGPDRNKLFDNAWKLRPACRPQLNLSDSWHYTKRSWDERHKFFHICPRSWVKEYLLGDFLKSLDRLERESRPDWEKAQKEAWEGEEEWVPPPPTFGEKCPEYTEK